MKKELGAIILGIVVVTATSYGQQMDEKVLQERIAGICEGYKSFFTLPEDARERALEGELSPEWMTEMLEGMVRKNLPILEEIHKDYTQLMNGWSDAYRTTLEKVRSPVLMLRYFHGIQTIELLKECIASTDHFVRDAAVDSYIAIKGGNAVPFLSELISKNIIYNGMLAQRFRWAILPELKKKNKHEDVATFHVFMLEQIQAEREWFGVEQLDKALCATLDGYPNSLQRKQAIERFNELANNMFVGDRYTKIRAEVDAVPADKRKDFRAKGELLDPERK